MAHPEHPLRLLANCGFGLFLRGAQIPPDRSVIISKDPACAAPGNEDHRRDAAVHRERQALDQFLVGRHAVVAGGQQAIDAIEPGWFC